MASITLAAGGPGATAQETITVDASEPTGDTGPVRRNIVEGEPGIFPDPIARLLVWIGRQVRRFSRTKNG